MKIHKPVKHARRKAMIAQKKAKGRYSRAHLPKPETCRKIKCLNCWAAYNRNNCLMPCWH